ncbi:MAG: potassium transporter Kup [Mycobacteriaceae bacterium]|nr:potassium transporter Kup [Mycobacteriaceae bacterium]
MQDVSDAPAGLAVVDAAGEPVDDEPVPHTGGAIRGPVRSALVIGALGVVFGDIGTSPIYTIQTVFNPNDPHPVPVSGDSVFGVVSLAFWSVMIIVTVTYFVLAMRADNNGEGGIMALITLLRKWCGHRGSRQAAMLAALGIFGASLFFGDSMITPAISVLSAVEGLETVEPSLGGIVVPATAVIIVLLFLVQRRGTAVVGRAFGPVMILWFATIGLLGITGIARNPEILKALSPTYALGFLFGHIGVAFFALAAIVLAVTGAEALYADMGHFGRRAITRAWLIVVLPACMLSYFGQGALVLDDPANTSSPFFLLAPGWARLPLVLLATAATVIASQAVITGAYSVVSQAAQLGYLPRMRIAHTSEHAIGQIYVPWINWLLMSSVLVLVFTFRSSAALAYAYGMTATGTITCTTVLFFYVSRARWGTPWWLIGLGAVPLLSVDLLFVSANLTKLLHGAWLPLMIALTAFTVMTTWQRGREIVTAERERREGSLRQFIEDLHAGKQPIQRIRGTAVFLSRGKQTAPLAFRANVEHNRVLHERVVIMSIKTEPVPRIPDDQRVVIDHLGYTDDGIMHVTARFGYMETPDVPGTLATIDPAITEGWLDPDQASYFLSTIDLQRGDAPTMARWRKRLFVATSHITADAAEYFGLPRGRTVIMGSHIDV